MDEEAISCKSIILKKFGGYDAISIEKQKLEPLEDNVEVKVEFGGLNFADLYTRQGLIDRKLPFVMGMECTGIVSEIGAKNCDLKVGQKVICYDYRGGMYRETVRVPADKCYPIPDDVSMEEGAVMFVNYLTAYFALFDLGNLKKNEKVLVLSCAGGVGFALTQLAKTLDGVEVFGTLSSATKEPEAKANGVDNVIVLGDGQENIQENLSKAGPDGGYDLIVSNQSGPLFNFLQNSLRPLGRIVVLGANNIIQNEKKLSKFALIKLWLTMKNVSLEELVTKNRVVAGLHLGTLIEKDHKKVRDTLNKIFDMLAARKIKPKIHAVYPMGKIVDATKVLAERKNIGKVLISMKETE